MFRIEEIIFAKVGFPNILDIPYYKSAGHLSL